MNRIITFIIINLFVFPAWSTNYFDENETCLVRSDLIRIEENFKQLKDITKINKPFICVDKDISKVWFTIARNLLALETLKQSSNTKRNVYDDLTIAPITNKNWWEYFVKRVNHFKINSWKCEPRLLAYVMRGESKVVNLCSNFFNKSLTSQLSILMHEVRHFDGYDHVTCERGVEEGYSGSCDESIRDGGSYAVSIQAFVGLSRLNSISIQERALLEGSTIYYINNKFNIAPKVKVNEMVYLVNADGKVFKAKLKDLANTTYVTTLKSPAKIYAIDDSLFALFPINKKEKAYRLAKDFKTEIQEIGSFAKKYNSEDARERDLYAGFSYLNDGFFVKGNNVYAYCSSNEIQEFTFPGLQGKAVVSFYNGQEIKGYIQHENGDLLSFECDKNDKLRFDEKYNLPMTIVNGMGAKNGGNYVLNDRGEFLKVNISTRELVKTKLPLNEWISAALKNEYVIFE